MNSLAEQLILKAIRRYMGLKEDQTWIGFQNRKIPDGTGPFVVANLIGATPIGVNKAEIPVEVPQPSPEPALQTLKESITVIMREDIQVDIFSRDNSALTRRYEMLAALRSTYCVQLQEANSFKIFQLPVSFANASMAEGGSNLNRFSMTIPCHVWYRKEVVLAANETFDEFGTRVDDYKTIDDEVGLIEFTIDETTPNPEGIV